MFPGYEALQDAASGCCEGRGVQVKFLSLSSGSSGNCYFLGRFDGTRCLGGLLVDAGVSIKRLRVLLADSGLSTDDFSAILVTHDHMDHVRSLASYCKKLSKPVWTSGTLADALLRRTLRLEAVGASVRELDPDGWTDVCGFGVRYFLVPHDATQTVGYAVRIPLAGRTPVAASGAVESVLSGFPGEDILPGSSCEVPEDGAFHNFFIMTDAGRVTDEAVEYAKKADTVVFESNYDVDMLMSGPYPHELKMRIMSGCGHLSNDECASAVRRFWHPGLRNLFLCHLSENNNTPRLAYETTAAVLRELLSASSGQAASSGPSDSSGQADSPGTAAYRQGSIGLDSPVSAEYRPGTSSESVPPGVSGAPGSSRPLFFRPLPRTSPSGLMVL